MNKKTIRVVFFLIGIVACSPVHDNVVSTNISEIVTNNPEATTTATPFQPDLGKTDIAAVETPQHGLASAQIYLPSSSPPSLKAAVQSWSKPLTDNQEAADTLIEMVKGNEAGDLFSSVYSIAAPFPTITDSVTFRDIQNTWSGNPSGPFAGIPLMMDANTLEAMKFLLGESADGVIRVVPSEQLLDTAWAGRPSWVVLPFELLNPRWKVIEVDGQSPLRKEFDPTVYPLKVNFACKGDCGPLPVSNRDSSKLTTLIMTGTTALVRATAYRMEINGLTYPAQDIGPILRDADILHISNEISFADDCPYPDPGGGNLQFCSDPKYIALLEDIGTDVVELTGNHVNDWGSQWLETTIRTYHDLGWGVFGGGLNLSDAMKPYTQTENGNKLAFIGCNLPGPVNAWATEDSAGAAPCGDYSWMAAEISDLRQQGYLPIATIQFSEYYQLPPSETQSRDFKNIAQAGAAIVSGSQSHFPQGFAFEGDTYIHYGPGNLFFDQMDYPAVGTRRAALDRYTIYDGKVVGVELITTMLEDWSRQRLMTLEERSQFLQELFEASGW